MTQPPANPPPGRRRWGEILLFVLILAIGAGFRIARCGYDNLVYDEIWQIETSSGRGSMHDEMPRDVWIHDAPNMTTLAGAPPWYTIWTHVTGTVHPPLFYISLRIWRDLFGSGEKTMRWLSITCSLATIGFLFVLGKRTVGIVGGAWAALLFAVAPPQFWLGQQVRDYAMLLMFCSAALLALVNLEKAGRASIRHTLLFGLALLGMMLTHYFSFGGAVAIGLYALIQLRGEKRVRAIIAIAAVAVIYCIIWAPFAFRHYAFAVEANEWLVTGERWHALLTLKRVLTLPWFLIVADESSNRPWPYLMMPLFVAPLMLLGRDRRMLLWWLWLVCSLGFLAVLDLTRGTTHLRYARYTAVAMPGALMLIVSLVGQLGPGMRHIVPGLLAIVAIASTPTVFSKEEPGWPELGQFLDQNVKPGEALFFYHGDMPGWYSLEFHMASAHYSHIFPRDIIRLTKPADLQLTGECPSPTAWLISGHLKQDVDQVIPGVKVLGQSEIAGWIICTHVELQTPHFARAD